jgi:hypothetical protein
MKIRTVLVLFTMTLLASCSRTPSSVLDDLTCDVPCWKGIVVGETSQDEALKIIEQIPEVQKETIRSWSEGSISWNYQGVKESIGSLQFHENKVTSFYSTFDPHISLNSFIKAFGEPSFVFGITTERVFPTMLTVYFIYPEKGICILHHPSILSSNGPKEYTISRRTKIMLVDIVEPSLPNGQLEEGCLSGLGEDTYNKYVREWTGYGKYEVFVPGIQGEQ